MQAPSDLLCPIAREVFETPVLCSDGFSYEQSFITKWIAQHNLSPMLGCKLPNSSLLENKTLSAYLNVYKGMRQRIVNRKVGKEGSNEEEKQSSEVKGELEDVLSHYYRSTLKLGDCCKRIEALHNAHPNNFEIAMNFANVLRFSAQFEKSLSIIKQLKEMRPASLIPRYMRVRVLSESGSKAKASQLLAKIQGRHRVEDHLLLETRFMSYALLSVDNRDTAYKTITTYLRLLPGDLRAVSHSIYINLLLESYKYVTQASKKYLREHPDDVSVMFYLGKAYAKSGKKLKAVATYKRILTIATDTAVRSKALYEAAVNRDCNTQFEKIVEELEESYRLDPREEADGYLAALYADKRMYSKAEQWITEYEKRMDIHNDQVFLGIKAQVLENNRRYEEAVSSYLRLSEIDQANSTYYNRRVEAILKRKMRDGSN
eukprot:TRINITY_DN10727_c0_g1_i1.p1 TRINITY_DN10727_c0_g1~~TRINITY_DN10727_c0_g1_i1.p1  ORF type:complete len:431 (+),score=115.99 TRINITY_DN10727_c0_g1_i1:219-1511(+)